MLIVDVVVIERIKSDSTEKKRMFTSWPGKENPKKYTGMDLKERVGNEYEKQNLCKVLGGWREDFGKFKSPSFSLITFGKMIFFYEIL